jgi:hypothetical protein
MTKLNWKQQSSGRFRALASRAVGGVYRIEYTENFCGSNHHSRGFWVRCYRLGYNSGSVSQTSLRSLEDAKALAEFHHQRLVELIRQHGREKIDWQQLQQEKLAFEERLPGNMRAEIKEKWRRLDAGWEGEPGTLDCPL